MNAVCSGGKEKIKSEPGVCRRKIVVKGCPKTSLLRLTASCRVIKEVKRAVIASKTKERKKQY